MEDYLMLEIPPFNPQYKKWVRYGYTNGKEKKNLQTVLEKCSEGYCMYCIFAYVREWVSEAFKNISCVPVA